VASKAKRPLVLVIEDDTRLVSALAMLIEDWGYECIAVDDLRTASTALGPRIGDVVAVVADLSDGDHWQGERSLAAVSGMVGPNVPVIATSTHPGQARRNGFLTVLAKPYEPEELHGLLSGIAGPQAVAPRAC